MAVIVPNNAIATEITSFVLQGRYRPSVETKFKWETSCLVTLHYGHFPQADSLTVTFLRQTLLLRESLL